MAMAKLDKLQKVLVAENFFPSPPTFLKKVFQENKEYMDDDGELREYTANHAHIIKELKKCKDQVDLLEFRKGMHLDIVDLLSNQDKRDYLVNQCGDHVHVNSLKDKYVVLCCIPVPIPNYHYSVAYCRSIIAARSCSAPNFEIVIVAKMISGCDREDVFDYFFSGFPDGTLAIPFWDVESRDHLFDSFYPTGYWPVYTLVVDPQGLVLQTDNVSDFYKYGSDIFPFTDEQLDELKKADEALRLEWDTFRAEYREGRWRSISGDVEKVCSTPRPSLAFLLGNVHLSKIDGTEAGISVSDLSKKVVGIYHCMDGSSLDNFHKFQQRCLKCDPGFVMVLVCIALNEDHSSFLDDIKLALKKREITSWLLLPYDDKTIRRLHRLIIEVADHLIIVPPDGKSAELAGRQVAQIPDFENPEYYPFTKESILLKRLSKLKSHKIESLLLRDFTQLSRGVIENNERASSDVPVAHLQGKKIILYLDNFSHGDDRSSYNLLLNHYSDIQREHRNSEVVFLPLGSDTGVPKMPWLMLPSPSDYVSRELLFNFHDSCRLRQEGVLMAFGEDGRILSRFAGHPLRKEDVSSLFNDVLHQEIFADLRFLDVTYDCY